MVGTRCDDCASISVTGSEVQLEATDAYIDRYLQSEAGIDAIISNLYRVDAPHGARFLDVGCNYGFGVRYARDVLGWQATGVEPSYAGRRGALDLGIEILDQYVTADTTLGDRFDVILASEVIEHVPDPAAFVAALRAHVAPGGTIVFTTPAAEVVTPASPFEAKQAIGRGGHHFLFSTKSFEDLLLRAGFGSVFVVRDGISLIATAAVEPGRALPVRSIGPSAQLMASFLDALVADPKSPPALATAMAVRHFRAVVNMAQDASRIEKALFERIVTQYGIDLTRPATVSAALAHSEDVPLFIAPAAFAAGMSRVVRRSDWSDAVDYFELAEMAVAEKSRRTPTFDGDSRIIEEQSRAHRLLALLHADPQRAVVEWQRLRALGQLIDSANWTVRLYVEAAAGKLPTLFDDTLAPVADAIVELGANGGDEHAMAAINGAYLLSRAAAAHGDRWCATQWCSMAELMLQTRTAVLADAWRDSAVQMLLGLRDEIATLNPEAIPSLVPMPGPDHEAILWEAAEPTTVSGGVSVVMALYRGEKFVCEALESIAAQTLAPLEVIVVDDGSSDNSVTLIESLDLPYDLRIVRQGNAGQSAARNRGIRAARGEFVAFLDQDDAWNPNHLELLESTLHSDPSLAWVFGDFDIIDGDGHTQSSAHLVQTGVVLKRPTVADIVRTDIMALPSASLMRRSALLRVRGFDRRLSGYEDDELYLRLYRAGYSLAFDRRIRVRYRTHDANASSTVAFLRSRLIYLRLLSEHYPGTHDRVGAAKLAAVRLLRSTTFEYVGALVSHNDLLARTIAWAMSRMMPLVNDRSLRRRLVLHIMMNPALLRAGLRASGVLPSAVRRRLLPPMALVARNRMHGSTRRDAAAIDLDDRPQWMRASA